MIRMLGDPLGRLSPEWRVAGYLVIVAWAARLAIWHELDRRLGSA